MRLTESLLTKLDVELVTIEQHCPCGARPESLHTHPHVGGCPVYGAMRTLGELRQALGLSPERTLIQHPFEDRTIYRRGVEPTVLLDHCGAVVNARLNSSTDGPEYCNRPRHEHMTP